MRAVLLSAGLALGALIPNADSFAQTRQTNEAQRYPSKPIRFIDVFAPGGGSDILARLIGQKLTERWGQPVVVDNRPGAGGIVGTAIAARATPDGHTLLIIATAFANMPSLYSKLPYDPLTDFVPVTLVASAPFILVVHPTVAASSVAGLIALAKAKPRSLNFASASTGSPTHLTAELFKSMAGIEMVHIPYKGGGPALAAVIAGEVQMTFSVISVALPYLQAVKVKALGVSSSQRSSVLPDVPTIAEAGLSGFEATNSWGVLVPARTPNEIVRQLNRAIVDALRMPDMKDRLAGLGVKPVGNTPAQYAAYIKTEMEKWAKVVKASGARIE